MEKFKTFQAQQLYVLARSNTIPFLLVNSQPKNPHWFTARKWANKNTHAPSRLRYVLVNSYHFDHLGCDSPHVSPGRLIFRPITDQQTPRICSFNVWVVSHILKPCKPLGGEINIWQFGQLITAVLSQSTEFVFSWNNFQTHARLTQIPCFTFVFFVFFGYNELVGGC